MPATAAIISGGLGVAKSIYGAIDSGKAKKELANLKPFDWKIQDEYFQNRNMAGNMATQGLDSASKDFYTTEAQRGLGSTFEAISQGGGNDPNITSGLMDNYNRGLANLAATDASKRLDNIKYFIGENAKLAGKLDIKQGLKFQDYQRNLKQLMERRATGQANLWGGIGDVVSSVGAYGTAKQNEDLMKPIKSYANDSPNSFVPNETVSTPLNLGNNGVVDRPLPKEMHLSFGQQPIANWKDMPNVNNNISSYTSNNWIN